MRKILRTLSMLLVISMVISLLGACSEPDLEIPQSTGDIQTNIPQTEIPTLPYTETITDTETFVNTETESQTETESETVTNTEAPTDAPTESESQQTTSKYPEGTFPLFSGEQYVVKVVMPDKASDTEKAVYNNLRNILKNKTNVTVKSETDFRAAGEVRDKNEYVILVGLTNYTESESVYKKTDISISKVTVVNNTRMVFCFATEAEGKALVTKFASSIKSDDSKYFWVPSDIEIKNTSKFKLETIPAYPTSTTKVDCSNDTTMLVAKNTNSSTYESYCNTLVQKGFKAYSARDNINGNYYRIYTKNSTALNVYYTAYTKTTRIVAGPLKDIPSKEQDKTIQNKKATLTLLAQEEATDCGLGIIYRLPNGKFLIFDGGFYLSNNLYKTLVSLADGDQIVIAGWFISHPHNDHQNAITEFLKKNASKVKIEKFFFNYAYPDLYETVTEEDVENGGKTGNSNLVALLEKTIDTYLDRTTQIITPHTGQVYNFGSSASVEILYTVEDRLPSKLDYVNTASLIVRFKVKDQTMLALADATHSISTVLQNTYGSLLKSDMVQLAHHGTYPGHASLYTKINASLLFWPSNTANAKAQYNDDAVREALRCAKDVYLAKGTTVTLNLPYTVKNNKQDFLKSIGKA